MSHDLLADPREAAGSFLVQVDSQAFVADSEIERRQRILGEFLLDFETAWRSGLEVAVHLRRLGLYSFGSPKETATGELSISAWRGNGSLRILPASPLAIELRLKVRARITYRQIARREELPLEPDSHVAPSELFRGSIDARLRFDPTSPLERRLALVGGDLRFDKTGESLGALRSLRIVLGQLPAFSLFKDARPTKILPLRPVCFPIGKDKVTGRTWSDQLAQARQVWSRCGVTFDPLPFVVIPKSKIGKSRNVAEILDSYDEEGAIEVLFVASNLNGHTYPAGTALAGIVIPEPKNPADPNLLAHELCHVLGGCHPQGDDCEPELWRGEYQTITDPTREIQGVVSNSICTQATEFPQPLLRTKL